MYVRFALVFFLLSLLMIATVFALYHICIKYRDYRRKRWARRNARLNDIIWSNVEQALYPADRVGLNGENNAQIFSFIVKNMNVSIIHDWWEKEYILQTQDVHGKAVLIKISDDEMFDIGRFIASEWIRSNKEHLPKLTYGDKETLANEY